LKKGKGGRIEAGGKKRERNTFEGMLKWVRKKKGRGSKRGKRVG